MTNTQYNIGDRLGNLTVVASERIEYKHSKQRKYTLKCDCGTILSGSASFIKIKKDKHALKCKRCLLDDVYQTRDSYLNYNLVYLEYKHKAGNRQIKFELTPEEAYIYFTSDCYFCGTAPSNKYKNRRYRAGTSITYSGIDRVDNNLGYRADNCVACCKRCNQAKNDMKLEEFFDMCSRVVHRLSLRGVGASASKQKAS